MSAFMAMLFDFRRRFVVECSVSSLHGARYHTIHASLQRLHLKSATGEYNIAVMPQLFWHTMVKWTSETGSKINDATIQSLQNEGRTLDFFDIGAPANIRPLQVCLYFVFTMRAMVSCGFLEGKSPPWPTCNVAPQPLPIPSGSLIAGVHSSILEEWSAEVGGSLCWHRWRFPPGRARTWAIPWS